MDKTCSWIYYILLEKIHYVESEWPVCELDKENPSNKTGFNVQKPVNHLFSMEKFIFLSEPTDDIKFISSL